MIIRLWNRINQSILVWFGSVLKGNSVWVRLWNLVEWNSFNSVQVLNQSNAHPLINHMWKVIGTPLMWGLNKGSRCWLKCSWCNDPTQAHHDEPSHFFNIINRSWISIHTPPNNILNCISTSIRRETKFVESYNLNPPLEILSTSNMVPSHLYYLI